MRASRQLEAEGSAWGGLVGGVMGSSLVARAMPWPALRRWESAKALNKRSAVSSGEMLAVDAGQLRRDHE